MKHLIYSLAACCCLVSCDVFDYHPYDLQIGKEYRDTNARNIERIGRLNDGRDSIRFVFMGDTQRFYDETEDFVEAVNARNDIDFVIHGGDVSDFGMKKEFLWLEDRMHSLKVPYVTLCGNHDILGSGEEIYRVVYGELNFAFIFGRTKFICINTNALEFDYATPVPDFEFIVNETADSTSTAYDNTVFVMHVAPGDVEFNNNVLIPFKEYTKRARNLLFCLHAHEHTLQVRDIFNDGVMYYGCETIKKRSYMVFTVKQNTYSYEVVRF